MNRKYFLSIIALLSIDSIAATIKPVDVFSQGDGKATYVEDTGLTWLDLSVTFNMSYSEVEADPTLGNSLPSHWRIATLEEVDSLFTAYGFTPDLGCGNGAQHCSQVGESNSSAQAIVGDFGGKQGFFQGMFNNPNLPSGEVGYAFADWMVTPGQSVDAQTWQSLPESNSGSNYGVLLVETAVVPLPASVWLFSIAVASFLGIRIRRRSS